MNKIVKKKEENVAAEKKVIRCCCLAYMSICLLAISFYWELSFNFQASLLKNDETKALTPALQKELNNLLKFNPDFAEVWASSRICS